MAGSLMATPVMKSPVGDVYTAITNLCATRRELDALLTSNPDGCQAALQKYQSAFRNLRSSVVSALPQILETAMNSSPYYNHSMDVRKKAHDDFVKQQGKISVVLDKEMRILLSVPDSNYRIFLNIGGASGSEAEPNLFDKKNKAIALSVEFEEKALTPGR